MGILDDVLDFFTGTENTETSQNINTTTQQDTAKTTLSGGTTAQTQERGTVTGEEQTTATSRDETVTQLDPETQALLQNLIQQLGGDIGGDDQSADLINQLQQSFAGDFATRAGDSGDATSSLIQDVINAARQSGEEQIGLQNRQIAERTGSSFNTLVQDITQQNTQDFETQLAGVSGQLSLAARESGTQEFLGASEALRRATESSRLGASSGVADLATLINSLKGATQTSALTGDVLQTGLQETQETTNSLQSVIEAIQELQTGKSVTVGSQTGEGSESGTIFDLFNTNLFRS